MVWVGRELQRPPRPSFLPWVEISFNCLCCLKSHSTWSRMFPGMEDPQLLWATCSSLTTLRKRFLFHLSNLNLPSFTLELFPLVSSLQAMIKCLCFSYDPRPPTPFIYWKAAIRWPPEPSLLQAEQSQLYQPVFPAEVLQSSDHFCGPPLDLF